MEDVRSIAEAPLALADFLFFTTWSIAALTWIVVQWRRSGQRPAFWMLAFVALMAFSSLTFARGAVPDRSTVTFYSDRITVDPPGEDDSFTLRPGDIKILTARAYDQTDTLTFITQHIDVYLLDVSTEESPQLITDLTHALGLAQTDPEGREWRLPGATD